MSTTENLKSIINAIEITLARAGYRLLDKTINGYGARVIIRDPKSDTDFSIKITEEVQ